MENSQENINLAKEEQDVILLSEVTPESITPSFNSVRNKDQVPFVNEDNEQWPDMIIELANNSATHGAIIQAKIDQVSGLGLVWEETEPNAALLDAWSKNMNSEGEDINEILWKVTTDLVLHNGYALLVNWSKDWTKIVSIEHLDFSKVRANKVDNDTGKVEFYWYSWDWSKQRTRKDCIPRFNMASAAQNKKAYAEAIEKGNNKDLQDVFLKPTTQLLYYKPYTPGQFYYPLPTYNGALAAIKTDILSDGYGLSSFESGLNASMIVTFFGLLTPDAQRKAVKKFQYMHEGSRGKKTIFHFQPDETKKGLEVNKIDSNKADGVYTSVNENTLQKILTAHRITDAILVGVQTSSGGFDGGERLTAAIDFWNKSVINPMQQEITKTFNKIMSINQFPTISIDPLDLTPEVGVVEEDVNSETNE